MFHGSSAHTDPFHITFVLWAGPNGAQRNIYTRGTYRTPSTLVASRGHAQNFPAPRFSRCFWGPPIPGSFPTPFFRQNTPRHFFGTRALTSGTVNTFRHTRALLYTRDRRRTCLAPLRTNTQQHSGSQTKHHRHLGALQHDRQHTRPTTRTSQSQGAPPHQ